MDDTITQFKETAHRLGADIKDRYDVITLPNGETKYGTIVEVIYTNKHTRQIRHTEHRHVNSVAAHEEAIKSLVEYLEGGIQKYPDLYQ